MSFLGEDIFKVLAPFREHCFILAGLLSDLSGDGNFSDLFFH